MHRRLIIAAALALAISTIPIAAAPPATAPAAGNTTINLPPIETKGPVTLPPEMVDALRKLSDDDYKTREQAVANLQHVMTRQFQQMVVLQNLLLKVQDGLADQLRAMTQGAAADEASTRVAGLMEFNSALSRWAIDVMALPEKQRDDLLKWGTTEEHLPLLARAYSRNDEVRAKAAREIVKIPGPEADWLIVQFLNDSSRELALTTIDALYDRKPSAAVLTAVWDRAVAGVMAQFRQRQPKQKTLTIHGRVVQIYDQDYNAQYRMQDADVAVDLLIKYKDPTTLENLNALFVELASSLGSQNDYRWRVILPNYGQGGQALIRLVDTFKPKQAVPFLVKVLAIANNNDGSDTTMNNEKLRYSGRIDAAAMLIHAIGQDPDDYNIKKYANWGDRWLIKGGLPEEEAMVKKLQAWWKEHASEYETPTTQPKSDKDAHMPPKAAK